MVVDSVRLDVDAQGRGGRLRSVSLLVAITFHFQAQRLRYLFEMVRALSDLPIDSIHVCICTNADERERLAMIRRVCEPFLLEAGENCPPGKSFELLCFPRLAHPWHLPWCHKPLLTERFLDKRSTFTHFLYIEDDILFTLRNLDYFLAFADSLAPLGLIPAFQRLEFNEKAAELRMVDQVDVIDLEHRTLVTCGTLRFTNPDYPYQAMFLMDRRMASEYVATRSFDRVQSQAVRPDWGLGERAAMGLCFEGARPGFSCRYVIPLPAGNLRAAAGSWIYHLPNNYTQNPRKPFGKLRPTDLFYNEARSQRWVRPPLAKRMWWKLADMPGQWSKERRPTGYGLVPKIHCPMCGRTEDGVGACARSRCPMMSDETRW